MGDSARNKNNHQTARDDGDSQAAVATREKTRVARPSMYRVVLLNDDFTPMAFVVKVLENFFHKTHDEAHVIMLTVHRSGRGVCGIYTYEIAETKVKLVLDFAKKHEHPLHCMMEKLP